MGSIGQGNLENTKVLVVGHISIADGAVMKIDNF